MKIFRDPIHNVINLDTGDETVNDLLINLIDSREFQRLHFIRQLGFTYLAYPSAEHTRFEHSLGVAFLAKRFIEKIVSLEGKVLDFYEKSENRDKPEHRDKFEDFFKQIKAEKPLAIVAALLHDVGHGPLSHVSEEHMAFKHEKWVNGIIMGDTEIHDLLVKFDKKYPERICAILSKSSNPSAAAKIISGQLDIDKMDYLLRDSHLTGAGYGRFDIEWLINVLTVGIVDGKVEIGLDLGKGLSVAEDFVMARIYMFQNIYLHKIPLIAQNMLGLLFKRIKELPREDVVRFFPNEGFEKVFFPVGKSLPETALIAEYLSISDITLYCFLVGLTTSDDEVVKRLSTGLLYRRLFKEISENEWHEIKQYVINEKGAGMDSYYAILPTVDAVKERLTYRSDKDKVFLFDKKGKGSLLHEKSVVIPPKQMDETYKLGYYADEEIIDKFRRRGKGERNEGKFEPNIDTPRIEELMARSIEVSRMSVAEDDRIHPMVGAVLCDGEGNELLTAYRGKHGEGAHCEFSLLEEAKERNIDLRKTVLFVTLEPCTKRGEGKIPCATRIVEAGIPKVYMGILDPNGDFRGLGEIFLREKGVVLERYPHKFNEQINEINHDFIEMWKAVRGAKS